jgi:Ca-activated chloride channel family protein
MNLLKNYQTLLVLSPALFLMSCAMSSAKMADVGGDFPPDTESQEDTESESFDDSYFPSNVGSDDEPSALISSSENGPSCSTDVNSQYGVIPPSGSTAGAVLARDAIQNGVLPPTPIRDSEFLNYYSPGFADLTSPQLFIRALPLHDSTANDIDLTLAVAVPSIAVRPALNLVLAVDTSSSMEGGSIAMAKAACLEVFKYVTDGDIVSVVTWNTTASARIDVTAADAPCDEIVAKIEAATNIQVALQAAYDTALVNASSSVHNHILFISDGGATAGLTDTNLVELHAAPEDGSSPIYLSALGTASSPLMYNENVMKMFSDAGKGAHFFADSKEEGQEIIKDRFFPRIGAAARNVTLTLTLPPQFQALGQSETVGANAVAPETAIELMPSSVLLFHEVLTPCEAAETGIENNITWNMSFALPNDQAPQSISVRPQSADDPASTAFAKVEIVLLFTDALRAAKSGNRETSLQKIDHALTVIENADQEVGGDADVIEMSELLNALKNLV